MLIIPSCRVGIRTCSDYSPFGVELDGRTVSGGYRYGYQGSEKDNETKGNGNSYTTEFRQLDPRLGRWLSIDPLFTKFPWQSPYIQANNNPIIYSDKKGLEAEDWIRIREKRGDKYMNKVVYDSNITTDEEAIKKYGENASKLKYGFQYHSEFNDQITLLENGTYDVNGSMRQATDLCSTGVSTEGNSGEESESQPNNSIMQQFIGDPNSSNHIDWNIDPSKHHYMYDFDDNMQKGCLYGAASLAGGGLLLESAPLIFTGFKIYHLTIGVNGGYANMGLDIFGQAISQSISKGSIRLGDFDLISVGTSALIRGKSPIGYQLSQGISSGLGQFSLNGGFNSPILNSSNSFTVSTMLIGTFSPLMNQVPLVKGPFGEILNESIPGFIQGALEAPDKK
jgi:RHS repeat-associated protein